MSNFLVGNVLLLGSIICGSFSQILIKLLLQRYDGTFSAADLKEFLDTGTLVSGMTSLLLLIVGFVLWVSALTKLPLSYAYPIACSSVLLVAYLSALLLGETVTPRIYMGTLLVLAGIVLAMPGVSR